MKIQKLLIVLISSYTLSILLYHGFTKNFISLDTNTNNNYSKNVNYNNIKNNIKYIINKSHNITKPMKTMIKQKNHTLNMNINNKLKWKLIDEKYSVSQSTLECRSWYSADTINVYSKLLERYSNENKKGINVYIVSAMKSMGKMISRWQFEVERLILSTPNIKYHLSIHENNSNDDTAKHIKEWYKNRIRKYVKSGVFSVNGNQQRQRHLNQSRIEYLADIRNRALRLDDVVEFKADVILYINDVLFCAEDLMRLIVQLYLHNLDAVCGIDHNGDTNLLYDIWVSQDRRGERMQSVFPYFNTPEENKRYDKGVLVPVFCCWNGAIALKAQPFVKNKYKFRAGRRGECRGSECTLLCKDFHNMGYDKFAIDPLVHVRYDNDNNPSKNLTRKSLDVLNSTLHDNTMQWNVKTTEYECRGVTPWGEYVDFGENGVHYQALVDDRNKTCDDKELSNGPIEKCQSERIMIPPAKI